MAALPDFETLAFEVERFDGVGAYKTQRLLKEGELGRTELVSDRSGALFVRKYLPIPKEGEHPYELLCGREVPHTPRVLEALRVGDALIVVCEHVAGEALADLVAEAGPVEPAQARIWCAQLAKTLAFLHALPGHPVVHRDVNPRNVIVNARGAWLIDFGISRVFVADGSQDTRVLGTVGYAAPEQFGFRQSDGRTDVYGLGRVFRFMLTGADDAGAGTGITPVDAAVIERACAFDPEDRYGSIEQMRSALLAEQGRRAEPVPVASSPSSQVKAPVLSVDTEEGGAAVPEGVGAGHRHLGGMIACRIPFPLQAVAAVFAVVMLFGCILAAMEAPTPSAVIEYVIVGVFSFLGPWVFTMNPLRVLDKTGWFSTRRVLKCALCIAACMLVLVVACAVYSLLGVPWTAEERSAAVAAVMP